MRLTGELSTYRVTKKERLEGFFAANDKIEVTVLQFRRLVVDGERASASATIQVSAIDAKTGKLAAGLGMQNRSFQFVREAGVWKIWREESSEAELAAKLVAAKDEEERAALLNSHKEFITAELCDRLAMQGRTFNEQSNYASALVAYQLAQTVAERVGDARGVIVAVSGAGTVQLFRGDLPAALDRFQYAVKLTEASGQTAFLGNLQGYAEVGSGQASHSSSGRRVEESGQARG